MRVRARGIYCSVDNFQISIVPICWKVSSASCLTNKIEMADSSHWLSRMESALRLLHVHCQAGISVRPGPPYTGQAYNRECGGLLSAYGLIKPTTTIRRLPKTIPTVPNSNGMAPITR